MQGWILSKPTHKKCLWLLILFHISFVAISSCVPSIAVYATIPCQAHWNESAVINQKANSIFPLELLQFTNKPPDSTSRPLVHILVFKQKQVRALFNQELRCCLNLWDPEETDMLKPCILACSIMLMSSAEMKGSLPVHAIQLLCSAFFFPLCWFCSKLSLPFVAGWMHLDSLFAL